MVIEIVIAFDDGDIDDSDIDDDGDWMWRTKWVHGVMVWQERENWKVFVDEKCQKLFTFQLTNLFSPTQDPPKVYAF